MSKKRLANAKTRRETGLDYVVGLLNIQTPFGKKQIKGIKPFFVGEESKLKRELHRTEKLLTMVKNNRTTIEQMLECFMEMKDIEFTVERSDVNTLSMVELYEVKSMLLLMNRVKNLIEQNIDQIPSDLVLDDVVDLLDILDPRKDRINTFYVYDEFSEKLRDLRIQKRNLEIEIRKKQKEKRDILRKTYGINLTPKFDLTVTKGNKTLVEQVEMTEMLEAVSQDYVSIVFKLKATPEVKELKKQKEAIILSIEEEEERVRGELSRKIYSNRELLLSNCEKIGKLDYHIAKAYFAFKYDCTLPEIVEEHIIEIEDGRHVQVEDVLSAKGKTYCPVSLSLRQGVTCITGANMGGKTVSLKLTGLIAILAQYGFFVPCRKARIGLSNYMQILIGDSQSLERGLSSFGGEMEELKEILDNSKERSLLLVDEIANGTNPAEATALTKAIVDYLKVKPYITLMTTHFDNVVQKDIVNLQVKGLSGVDFELLDREIRYANRRERINIIGKYMDYRLQVAKSNNEIPKDAINIAKMLGIDGKIIQDAKDYLTMTSKNSRA